MNNTTPTIADTIAIQLGGIPKLHAMIDAHYFLDFGDGLGFHFKGSRKANVCQITLDASDTYTFKLLKYNKRTLDSKTAYSATGIYADMLVDVFERNTGLYLSL